jgi:hypothetical protein
MIAARKGILFPASIPETFFIEFSFLSTFHFGTAEAFTPAARTTLCLQTSPDAHTNLFAIVNSADTAFCGSAENYPFRSEILFCGKKKRKNLTQNCG